WAAELVQRLRAGARARLMNDARPAEEHEIRKREQPVCGGADPGDGPALRPARIDVARIGGGEGFVGDGVAREGSARWRGVRRPRRGLPRLYGNFLVQHAFDVSDGG